MGNITTEERKYQKMLQRIRGFRLLDDDFMTKCFEENIEATELVLRIVLNKLSIPMQKCILFGNSEHPFPEKQSIPFRSRVQLMISTQMESLFHVM